MTDFDPEERAREWIDNAALTEAGDIASLAKELRRAYKAGQRSEREKTGAVADAWVGAAEYHGDTVAKLRALASKLWLRAAMAQERARGASGETLAILDEEHLSWATEAAALLAILDGEET